MIATDRQHYALQTIFSFFLGLMVLAFVGVGVNTFYPSPAEKYTKRMQETSRRQESLNSKAAPGSFTPEEQAQLDSLRAEQDALNEKHQAELKDWARVTSIILVLFATLVLVVSLTQNERIRVISNGLLLGGLFTMVYGVGWVVFSGNSVARFWVILFALIVAIGLGYLKFVRGRQPQGTPRAAAGIAVDEAVLGPLSARVTALEERAAAAAAALSGRSPEGP
jgi:hypothetical protein